jgi:hypothetical protein
VICAEESVEINRRVEEVFSYTSNPENFPEWAATVIEVRLDAPGEEDPLNREGERFTFMQEALGRRFEAPSRSLPTSPTGATRIGVRKDIRCRLLWLSPTSRCRRRRHASRPASRQSRMSSSGLLGRCLRG